MSETVHQEPDDWELFTSSGPDATSDFATLVARHYRSAIAFCSQMLGDAQASEDAVQRGFVRLFQARDRYEKRARFRTLLFRVLTNLCLNEIERRREPVVAVPRDGDHPAEVAADPHAKRPEDRLAGDELAGMIAKAIAGLPPKHRAAIFLREYDGLAYAEIAATLDASLAEVKIWIHRGRLGIQERLRPYLDHGEPVR